MSHLPSRAKPGNMSVTPTFQLNPLPSVSISVRSAFSSALSYASRKSETGVDTTTRPSSLISTRAGDCFSNHFCRDAIFYCYLLDCGDLILVARDDDTAGIFAEQDKFRRQPL